MQSTNHYVVIMAGGLGSRFWPESRAALPKQFLDILGTGQTLIQSTFDRLKPLCPIGNIFIITHHSYKDLVASQLKEMLPDNIITEPSRKNTAPAAAYINSKIHALNPEAKIVLCPADHLITNERVFIENIEKAFDFVTINDAIVTLGIKPTRPDTGYGYIQYNMDETNNGVYKVKTFTEKPNLEIARTFLKSGDFLWNSGMFIWSTATFLQEFRSYLPEMADIFQSVAEFINTPKEEKIIEKIYTQCTSVSIDYGVMEKSQKVYVIPSTFGWSDLGTWESAHTNFEKDNQNNAIHGEKILIVDAQNNYIKIPKNKLAVIQGLDNFIIVDTENVLLICERNKEQEIKDYVADVKRQFGDTYL